MLGATAACGTPTTASNSSAKSVVAKKGERREAVMFISMFMVILLS
jgi:hypothetical protein